LIITLNLPERPKNLSMSYPRLTSIHPFARFAMSAEDHSIQSRLLSFGTKGVAIAAGAAVIGAVAAGAVAIGSLALGALAIRKFVAHRGRIARLHVEELTVDRLIVNETNSKP
jgi:hypothetical protein